MPDAGDIFMVGMLPENDRIMRLLNQNYLEVVTKKRYWEFVWKRRLQSINKDTTGEPVRSCDPWTDIETAVLCNFKCPRWGLDDMAIAKHLGRKVYEIHHHYQSHPVYAQATAKMNGEWDGYDNDIKESHKEMIDYVNERAWNSVLEKKGEDTQSLEEFARRSLERLSREWKMPLP